MAAIGTEKVKSAGLGDGLDMEDEKKAMWKETLQGFWFPKLHGNSARLGRL